MEVHVIRQGPKRVKRDNPESRYGHLLVRPFLLDVRHAAFHHLMMLQILKFEWTPPFSFFFLFKEFFFLHDSVFAFHLHLHLDLDSNFCPATT